MNISDPARGRPQTNALALICLGAVALRVLTGWLWPNIVHPDESFQYLEQAYRLVTGRGVVPWEYEVGARSWLLAWSIVPVTALVHAVTADPAALRLGLDIYLALLSCAAIAAAWRIGRIIGGERHAIFAALIGALWCELVYMAPHMLADGMSAILLLSALAAGARLGRASRNEIFLSGLLFGFALIVRPQLAPACGIAMLWIAGIRPSARWLAMAAGAIVPVLLLGLTDWISWGKPFHSITTYLYVNSSGIADIFGTEPPSWYLKGEVAIWGVATPLILLTAAAGTRRAPLLTITALLVLATFAAVPHKEWRFIYPALPIIFTLCGLGTADLIEWLARAGRLNVRTLGYVAAALWLTLSLLSGVRGTMRPLWQQSGSQIRALDLASADPAACGLGIDPAHNWEQAGMVRMRADMRFLGATPEATPGFNYLMSVDKAQQPARFAAMGYAQVACFPRGVCLYKRPGGCDAALPEITAQPSADVAAKLRTLGAR